MQTGITDAPKLVPVNVVLAEVEYRLTEADYAAWWAYNGTHRHQSARPTHSGPWFASLGGVSVGLLIAFFLLVACSVAVSVLGTWQPGALGGNVERFRSFLTYGLVTLLLGSVILLFVVRTKAFVRWARNVVRNQPAPLPRPPGLFDSPHPNRFFRFVVTAEGFTETATLRESKFGLELVERKEVQGWWSSLEEIVVLDQQILFVMQRNQGAFIIPRRAFADEQAFHSFVETARNCLEKANAASELTAVRLHSTAITNRS